MIAILRRALFKISSERSSPRHNPLATHYSNHKNIQTIGLIHDSNTKDEFKLILTVSYTLIFEFRFELLLILTGIVTRLHKFSIIVNSKLCLIRIVEFIFLSFYIVYTAL